MSDLVERAQKFATWAHIDTVRADGHTMFITHPAKVVDILKQVTDDEVLLAAAWLHDVIEDEEVSYEDIRKEFGDEVADLVHEVTHEGEPDSHGYYFPRLKSQRGIMLKFADRLSNISDMADWDDKRREHYLRKSRFWKSE